MGSHPYDLIADANNGGEVVQRGKVVGTYLTHQILGQVVRVSPVDTEDDRGSHTGDGVDLAVAELT